MMKIRRLLTCLASAVLMVAFSTASFAQGRASLRGQISDEFGASIVGATVTLTDPSAAKKTPRTNADGAYTFNGLVPGKYKVHDNAAGFATSKAAEVNVPPPRRDPLNIS